MSALIAHASKDEIAITTSVKTVMQIIAAANHRVKLLAWGIHGDASGDTPAEAVKVEILRQTTAGTGGDALTLIKNDGGGETVQTTGLTDIDSAEPISGDILFQFEFPPHSGLFEVFPAGQEIIIPGGTRLGIRCTAAANVNVRAYMRIEE